MTTKIPRPILFLVAFLFAALLYWPALQGTPIWDDYNFWFTDHNMTIPYTIYWTNFSWPLSVSLQKFMLTFFQKNFFWYHSVNLLLHFGNSVLVYKLARTLNLRYPFLFFLLFLLHPSAVITTAWMIQLKTLLCFFFAILSFLAFLKARENQKWVIVSWIMFACSLMSKTASITLPLVFLVLNYRAHKFSKFHLLIPYFLISVWGTYRIVKSPAAREGTQKAFETSKLKLDAPAPVPLEDRPEGKKVQEPSAAPMPPPPRPPELPAHLRHNIKTDFQAPTSSAVQLVNFDFHIIGKTLNYYFWQSLIPQNNIPVKGLNFNPAGLLELTHAIFLVIMAILFWNDVGLLYLLAAQVLLLPFLGIVPAPYMNITWVSDQHLYLVLPALLAFWMRMLEKLNWKYGFALPCALILFFSYKTHEATPFYQDQFTFYEKCLEYDPHNVPMAYNLAFARILNGELDVAYDVLKENYDLAQQEPIMKKNFFYPFMAQLYVQVKKSLVKENEN